MNIFNNSDCFVLFKTTYTYSSSLNMSFRRRGSFARNLRSIEPDYSDFLADGGVTALSRNQWFFEIAWEVANKGYYIR